MCGIIAIAGSKPVVDRMITGLRGLEYRGYDSSGVATVHGGVLERRRAAGKLENLKEKLLREPLEGNCGIGHIRWATHGQATETNAHPHMTDLVALVHNGIIENHHDLRKKLLTQGHTFESETDTEVLAHLLTSYLQEGMSPEEALKAMRSEARGAYAIAVLFKGHDNLILAAREGSSPLAIGLGEGENYVGSDALALTNLSNRVMYLQEGDWAIVTPSEVKIFGRYNAPVKREIHHTNIADEALSREGYDHFMLKEIFEQPLVVEKTLSSLINEEGEFTFSPIDWKSIERVTFTACGTAFYAGMVARYWFETIAGLPFDMDVASEFRYRTPPLPENGLCLIVSQSGETADTIAALEYAKSKGQHILSIVNVKGSAIERASDTTLHTLAGPEIGVASTKAFTTQLAVLAVLAVNAALVRGRLTPDEARAHLKTLLDIPAQMHLTLNHDTLIKEISTSLEHAKDTLFLGRGINYPMALEGSLKLKEISYIHAEAYPAGEMKHGPIALLETGYPVIVSAPYDELIEKTASNAQEVLARGARLIVITDARGKPYFADMPCDLFETPNVSFLSNPFITAIPLQLLAYYTALKRGTDVDQPRNLAKSVTVE